MKNALISVSTVNITDGESEQYELTAEGTYFNKNGIVIIKYEDEMLSDDHEKIATSIKISADGAVTVTRSGKYESRIEIIENRRSSSAYTTPYGTLIMGFYGKKIEHSFNENGGSLCFEYTVDVNDNVINENKITVTVKEV